MTKPIASLSLDLDNKWAYLRTHSVPSWEEYPSYLDVVVPRMLRWCDERELRMTVFIVGQDARRHENRAAIAEIAAAGHEIGNHSHNHYPWMHTLSREQVEAEIVEAEEHIERVTGQRPVGFRSPGYSYSAEVLEVLAGRGYLYDASTLPTFLGPLARWYVRHTASPEADGQAGQRELFGSLRDGLLPIKPYVWVTQAGSIVEIPVTTFPILRLPIHMTYLVYLSKFSMRLARTYFRLALAVCRTTKAAPSILLHPLDFLGAEDDTDLQFFPGMNVPLARKSQLISEVLQSLRSHYNVQPLTVHAATLRPMLQRSAPTEAATEVPARELVAK